MLYPYYIIAYFDSSILHKIYTNHKFKCYNDCINAIKKMKESKYRVGLFEHQIVIIEYSGQYNAKILNIIDNNQEHIITEPLKYEASS